ncbi:hypothetical protein LOTGIDRAFT_238606 [Lottia gigantea]|uniref:VWFA domain-containing protein n=1 Tax=Lottia gigantea TaxID=225164 RepID=V4CEC4_LOTGI|nr:hypothetical protein LOTGIDRAFT_238606 [Lottia gigantea]ESP00325.1 hypothetical protein LOTGIDRAFT_238606 [Lottia gigantea]
MYSIGSIIVTILLVLGSEGKPTDWFNRLQSDSHTWFGERDTSYKTVPNGCGGKPADVYFVLDTSDDVTAEEVEKQKQYASELVNLFYLEQDTVRVGVVAYGDKPKLIIRSGVLDQHHQIRNAIAAVPKIGGKKDTGNVLSYLDTKVFTDFGSRRDAGHFIIMLTNGNSGKSKMESWNANSLKKKGVYIFTVTTGRKSKMVHMASSPAERFVFSHDNLKIVESLISLLHIKECDYQISPPFEGEVKVCEAKRPVDVIFGVEHFGLGTSRAGDVISFIYDILREFDTNGDINTGMMLSKSSGLSAGGKLVGIKDLQDKIAKIRFPNLADLLRRMRRSFSRGRKGMQRTAVVFLDENVEITKKAKIEAKRNKFVKIETYVIYIGKKDNMKNLKMIANGYGGDNVIIIPSYDDLPIFKLDILKTVCRGF